MRLSTPAARPHPSGRLPWYDTPEQRRRLDDATARARLVAVDPEAEAVPARRERWRRAGELGFLGLSLPRATGGGGLDARSTARALEGFATGCDDPDLVLAVAGPVLGCGAAVAEFGTPAARRRHLPALCTGDTVAARTSSVDDEQPPGLRATPIGGGSAWRLSGRVRWHQPAEPDLFLVEAGTGPDADAPTTVFLVEADRPGVAVTVTDPAPTGGLVELDGAVVPASAMLGGRGQARLVQRYATSWSGIGLFACHLARVDAWLDAAPAADRRGLAESKMRVELVRWLLYRACGRIDDDRAARGRAVRARLGESEASLRWGAAAAERLAQHGPHDPAASLAGLEAVARAAS